MFNSLKNFLVAKSTNDVGKSSEDARVNCGAELLSHFKDEWAQLHEFNEDNAAGAQQVAETINTIHLKMSRTHFMMGQIANVLNKEPTLVDTMRQCVSNIDVLRSSFEDVQMALIRLEDLIGDVELGKQKMELRHQLSLYKDEKLANLETVRANLMEKHTKNIMESELKQKQLLEERQQVFEAAFKNDLTTYKQRGELPRPETSAKPSALLEDIQIECDDKELDQFLNEN